MMNSRAVWLDYGRDHPLVSLSAIFVLWKLLIISIALTSPGIGYDTSTSLISWAGEDGSSSSSSSSSNALVSNVPTSMQSPLMKFVRWDAIYFTHMAEHGLVYEQEWAFGVGWSSVLSWAAGCKFVMAKMRGDSDFGGPGYGSTKVLLLLPD
jgi:hypothetical protein